MKITRKFAAMNSLRPFRILINDEFVGEIGPKKDVEIEQPKKAFTFQFVVNLHESSKKILIDTHEELFVFAEMNPLAKWLNNISMIMIMIFMFLMYTVNFYFSIGAAVALVLTVLIHMIYLRKNYILFTIYDKNHQLLDFKEIKL